MNIFLVTVEFSGYMNIRNPGMMRMFLTGN